MVVGVASISLLMVGQWLGHFRRDYSPSCLLVTEGWGSIAIDSRIRDINRSEMRDTSRLDCRNISFSCRRYRFAVIRP